MNVRQLCDPAIIRELLGENGFRFSKSKGQNFLIDPSVPVSIVQAAGVDDGTGVLEVGPGIGCLTAALAQQAGKVVSVELDTALRPVLDRTLAEYGNVEIVYGDVMRTDLRALVKAKLPDLRPVVCANLPYNITTPVITAFLEAGCFDQMTVMIQREVARRMDAKAGTADYGAFTLLVQWYAETDIRFDVPPHCFMPAPKVVSSVITLKRRSAPPVPVSDEKLMFRVIRAAFNQRRKTLVNALSGGCGDWTKDQIAAAVRDCGLDERVRGEALDLPRFAALTDCLAKYKEM